MWNIWKVTKTICVVAFLRLFTSGYETEMVKYTSDTYPHQSQGHCSLNEDKLMTLLSHHVAIITKPTNRSSLWCGGTIISGKYILTAAHCLEGSSNVTIILYEELDSENNVLYRLESRSIQRHPKWQPQLLLNDLALVESPRSLRLPDLSPIHIPPDAKVASKRTVVFGWGKNSKNQPTLNKHEVAIIRNKQCVEYYGSLITKSTICAKGRDLENGCHGFSGGGLVGDGLLIGVVSFGTDQCDVRFPTVYTKVSRYKKWIRDVVGT